LTAGGDYCPVEFKIFWQDSRYNLPTPQHFYPSVDKLKSTKATQKLTQGFVGSKYMFTDGSNKWRPYIGAAYTAMKILPFEAEFEVQNTATNVVRTLKAASTGINIANLLLLDGGLEYRFNRRFVAQGEVFYNMDMNRPKKTYDLFGVRGAFLVSF
jgi:outer membrane protein W